MVDARLDLGLWARCVFLVVDVRVVGYYCLYGGDGGGGVFVLLQNYFRYRHLLFVVMYLLCQLCLRVVAGAAVTGAGATIEDIASLGRGGWIGAVYAEVACFLVCDQRNLFHDLRPKQTAECVRG